MFQQVWLLAAAMPAVALAGDDTYYTGDGTSHTLGNFSTGKCNFMYDPGVGDYYAALNSDQWDSTLNCGRCADVWSDDSTSAATVYIVDECPECDAGGLGLSSTVIKLLGRSDPSRFSIKWTFVDCPVNGNIEYCANSLSNGSWLAVQPANSVTGVARMKIANQDVTMVDSCYYFLLNGGSNVGMSAVDIELTSISGETITETLALTAGNCTTGTSNFGAGTSQQHESEVNKYFNTRKAGSSSGYKAGKVTAADDTMQANTRSGAVSSGTNLLLVAPVLLAVVGSIVVAAISYIVKKKKLADQRIDREQALTRPFGTLSSPVLVGETIAKI